MLEASGPSAVVLPRSRGPISAAILDALVGDPVAIELPVIGGHEALGDDAQLALHCCYELHYHSFAGVHEGWEWAPELLAVRRRLEHAMIERLRDAIVLPARLTPEMVVPELSRFAAAGTGPSLSKFMEEHGTLEHMREFCVHRSLYQLKEADPHSWVIPRLSGPAKAAAVAIQHDEYGGGVAERMHSSLFAVTLRELGLDDGFGAYVDFVPGTTLATDNLVSLFGLHREWRAACVGHLALFEMTSVEPMARYSRALRRLGVSPAARAFYDAHVVADAWHERIAERELVGGLVADDPQAARGVLFGASALMEVESDMTRALLDAWHRGRTSMRQPLPATPTGGRALAA